MQIKPDLRYNSGRKDGDPIMVLDGYTIALNGEELEQLVKAGANLDADDASGVLHELGRRAVVNAAIVCRPTEWEVNDQRKGLTSDQRSEEWIMNTPVKELPTTGPPEELAVGGINLLGTTDALVWANEFQRIVVDGGIKIDAELMLGWFANAMCAQMDLDARRALAGET